MILATATPAIKPESAEAITVPKLKRKERSSVEVKSRVSSVMVNKLNV